MTNSNGLNQEEIVKLIKNLDEKMNDLSSILQKFGLDLITKLGQTNSTIKMLADKIIELDKATIDIKALLPKLNNIINNQKLIENELDLIKSLTQKVNVPVENENELKSEELAREELNIKNKPLIIEQLTKLKKELNTHDNTQDIVKELENVKEYILELIGGHRILYDISQAINKLSTEEVLSEKLKNYLRERINYWIIELKVS